MTNAQPAEFLTEALNAAKNNVGEAITRAERSGLTSDKLLRVAEIQAEMAKATALAMIAQALNGVATPGQSIRYGMADVAAAISKIQPKEGS